MFIAYVYKRVLVFFLINMSSLINRAILASIPLSMFLLTCSSQLENYTSLLILTIRNPVPIQLLSCVLRIFFS